MPKPVIATVSLSAVDANPHRDLATYPFNKRKLRALRMSIHETGFWEGVIARKVGRRYEIAFGHHRIEAAKQEGLTRVPLIIRDLDDRQMLQFMGLENLEDYKGDFLVQLNTWEAGVREWKRESRGPGASAPSVEIARLLCWSTGAKSRITETAQACNAAHRGIEAKLLKRSQFKGLSVDDARKLAQPFMARIDQLEDLKETHTPEQVAKVREQYKGAAEVTAERLRTGKITAKQARSTLDDQATRARKKSNKPAPLFSKYMKDTTALIDKMLSKESAAVHRLKDVAAVRNQITLDEDFEAIAIIESALDDLIERAEAWRDKIRPTSRDKVIDFEKARKALG